MLILALSLSGWAQNSTKSPYSQFGLGELSGQGVGFNKGMSGVGLAFRRGNEVNPMNPASYSSIDSLTMVFDAGFSGQITNYKEGTVKDHASTGGFDYAVGTFRLMKNLGVAAGVMPYSNIGYSYSTSDKLYGGSTSDASVTTSYNGEGGISQLFLGLGWRPAKPLSVGVNVSYLWGDYLRRVSSSASSSVNTLAKEYLSDVSSYKLELGLQYEQPIGKEDQMSVGVTFSPGHQLHADATQRIINSNSSISKADTTTVVLADALALPTTWGVGLGYQHGSSFRLGADFIMQKWGSMDFPSQQSDAYVMKSGLLKDCYRMNVGAEWIPNQMSRKLLNHVRYRIGAGYTTPYYYINGQDGPKDFHVSLGFGIPIANGYNNRSFVNVSGQWQHRSADQLITENAFVLSIGLTFNERWFAKWKVE